MPEWKVPCVGACPRNEVEFICQTVILFVVICVSLYNLTVGEEECKETLWASLLSGSVGICAPGPVINRNKATQNRQEEDELDGKRRRQHSAEPPK